MSINSPRSRSAAYRIPGVCALALLGGAGIWSANRAEHEYTSAAVITKAPRALLSLHTGSADVKVSPGTGTAIRIERRSRWIGERPTHSMTERADGQIVLDDHCPGGISVPVALFSFHDGCSITYEVQVPAGQAISIDGGSGDIELRDLDGRVTAIAGSGDLSASGLISRSVALSAGSGDISATLDRAPVTLRAIAGSGDVSLHVPGDAYRLTVSTGSGDRSVSGLSDHPASKRSIVARTGSGDISVRSSS
jgi:hypothetical protein